MCDSRQKTKIMPKFNFLIFLKIGYAQLHVHMRVNNYANYHLCRLFNNDVKKLITCIKICDFHTKNEILSKIYCYCMLLFMLDVFYSRISGHKN